MNTLTFVYLNVVNGFFTGAEYELYSAYWQSYLRKNGIKTRQYINTECCTAAQFVEDIAHTCNGRVVFFVGEYNYYITKVIVTELRSHFPGVEMIAAGPVAKYIFEQLRDDFPVDYFCVENEFSKLLAIARLPKFSEYSELPAVRVPANEIPHPYSMGVIPPHEVINTGLIASRGCPGKCSFCSYDEEYLMFSPKSVADELKFIYQRLGRQNITINFFDECFGLSTVNAIALCNAIKAAEVPYDFFCWCRLDMLSDELLIAFGEARFNRILVGLESASERILRDLGKLREETSPLNFLSLLPERISFASKLGIDLMTSVNIGLDGEEISDVAKTLKYIEDNNLRNVSVNYTTTFPKSRMFAKYVFYPERMSESPTRLPLRTFYPNLNISLISRSNTVTQGNFYLWFREEKMRSIAVDFYCNIKKHGEGLSEYNNIYTDTIKTASESQLILGGNCLVSEVEDLKFGRIFSDERKPLKCENDRYDLNLKLAYESNVYIENQLFLQYRRGHCNLMMNNVADYGRFKFRYFGNDLNGKTELLKTSLNSMTENCIQLEYGHLTELIFDDMGSYLEDYRGRLSPSENKYLSEDIRNFYAEIEKNPFIPIYTAAIIFIYKNKLYFDGAGTISIYFNSRFKCSGFDIKSWVVLISCYKLALLYDTRGKNMAVLKKEEKDLLLSSTKQEGSLFECLKRRLNTLMKIEENK